MSLRAAFVPRLLIASVLVAGGTTVPAQEVPSANAKVAVSEAGSLPERPANEDPLMAAALAAARVHALPVASQSSPTRWVTSAEWSGRSYRWSAQRGRVDIGIGFDASDPALRPLDLRGDPAGPLVPTLPTISLGMRRVGSVTPASLLERALGASDLGGSVSRVGIEWKPAQPQVSFLREGLGVRLDGNDRMTVRLRKGMLSIYMHRKF